MKKYFLLIAIAFISIPVLSQQEIPKEEKPNIEVTGSAEMEVTPDEIYVSVVLREKNKNNDKWKIEIQEDNLMKKLKENGFDLQNLNLTGADGDLQYSVFRKNKVITEKRLLMKVKNAGEVNKLFHILDDLEIEEAGISKTSHSQIEKFRKDVKIEAIKAAKIKADYLLTAIGEQPGKPLFIREEIYTTNIDNLYKANIYMRGMARTWDTRDQAIGFENNISFTSIKIRYDILARFEIK